MAVVTMRSDNGIALPALALRSRHYDENSEPDCAHRITSDIKSTGIAVLVALTPINEGRKVFAKKGCGEQRGWRKTGHGTSRLGAAGLARLVSAIR